MKKLIGAVISVIVAIFIIFAGYEYTYRLSPENFITDKTTFIYGNKNLTDEKVKNIIEALKIENKFEKELLKKIDSIYILSQSKIYSGDIKAVGIVDSGKYYPLMLLKLEEFFDLRPDRFYKLKAEFKKELDISEREDVFLKAHRGLFFISTDIENIEKLIQNRGKISNKTIDIIRSGENYNFGVFVFNQERERLLGIDRIAVFVDVKDRDVFLDGFIYGDNDLIKNLGAQPSERKMPKYIKDNMIYISTLNLKKMDTFILRAISLHAGYKMKEMIKELFSSSFSDIFLQLSGEMLIDIENGNYIFGLKSSNNVNKIAEYFKENKNINVGMDTEENYYIIIGNDTFFSYAERKDMEPNQFLSGKIDTYYGKIEIDGFYEENSLKIKSQLHLRSK